MMDTNISLTGVADVVDSERLSRDRIFKAASEGDVASLDGLLEYLKAHRKTLCSPEFLDPSNGKTALVKALLNLKNGKNDTIPVLLDIAEKTEDLGTFVNKAYTDSYYKGQTPLHVAIERRSLEHVKLLVEKGANVQAKANGSFFQYKAKQGFYFGELPLSMAACTNQMDMVLFLMGNSHRRADVMDRDSQGNTVLHVLAIVADNTQENTDAMSKMYDAILLQHRKADSKSEVDLEAIENKQHLTPLKLMAKLGKVGLFRHMLQREFLDEETRPLSRKVTEWVYGPIRCSLYETTSLDTDESRSVLELLIFGSTIPHRPEMLQVEPLRTLLERKWKRYASQLFLLNFLIYLSYMVVFTVVAIYRNEGVPPFAVGDGPLDVLYCIGEIITIFGALHFFLRGVVNMTYKPPKCTTLYIDGFSEILFFLQGGLLLVSVIMYVSGMTQYVCPVVISLTVGWINILHYSGGSKELGIYHIMMQRMILGNLLRFLLVYGVFLFGFSTAILVLMEERHAITAYHRKTVFKSITSTTLELFKVTIGMGQLEVNSEDEGMAVFYFLLILYVTLTYILLLNMLIALMGHTVNKITQESEDIWKLQRALAILSMEASLPTWLSSLLRSKVEKTVCFKSKTKKPRKFIRVEESNWKEWRSDVCIVNQEDPGSHLSCPEPTEVQGSRWDIPPLLHLLRSRHHSQLINNL